MIEKAPFKFCTTLHIVANANERLAFNLFLYTQKIVGRAEENF